MGDEEAHSFAELFDHHLRTKGISVDRLSTMIEIRFRRDVSSKSMRNWRDGRSRFPRDWQDVAAAASALDLTRVEADTLLKAAGHPPVDQLLKQAQGSIDALLLVPWLMALPSEQLEEDIASIKDNTDRQRAIQQRLESKTDDILAGQHEILSWVQIQSKHELLPLQKKLRYFTGRIDELKRLEQLLLPSDDEQMGQIGVQIAGTGGMGKSSLAYQFAHEHLYDFKDGVIILTIDDGRTEDAVQPYTPLTIARRLLQIINHARTDYYGSTIDTMLMAFRQKHLLLILDNVEDAEAIKGLIPGGNCKVIVTTRNRSLLDDILPDEARIELHGFSLTETQDLLSKFIDEQRIATESDGIMEIHEIVGGLPLALRIVASALKYGNKQISSYATMLREEKLSLLRDPDKHKSNDPDRSVRASFNISLYFLTDEQRALFACLSACTPEGFSSNVAQVVSEQSNFEVSSGLDLLVRLSLVDLGTEIDRFLLHPLLYDFACDLARKENLFEIAEQRHTVYFLRCIEDLHKNTPSARKLLEQNLEGFLLAARYLPSNLDIITTFYLAVEPLLQKRGYWEQALELLDRRLELARKQENYYETAQSLIQRSQFLARLARWEDAETELKAAQAQALLIDNKVARQKTLGMALNSLGTIYRRMKRFDEAITALQQSYNIRKALDDTESLILVLNSLGGVYEDQHRNPKALETFQQSLALAREKGMDDKIAVVLNSLGVVYKHLQRYDEAIAALEESYDMLIKLGDEVGQAKSLNAIAGLYQEMNKLDEALEHAQKSVSTERKARGQRGLAMALTTLGTIYRLQQDYDQAVVSLQEALSLEEKLRSYNGQIIVLNQLGRTFLDQKDYPQALKYLQASFAIVESRKILNDLPRLVELLIEALTPLQQLAKARRYCTRALALLPGNKHLQQLQKRLPSNR